jgi:hypothetical protein
MRQHRPQNSSLLRWVWIIPCVSGIWLYEVVTQGSAGQMTVVWLSVFSVGGALLLARVCRVRDSFDLFEPLYMATVLFLLFYPLRALFGVWLDESWFEPRAVRIALFAAGVGLVCFAIGYRIAGTRVRRVRSIWLDREWDLRRARRVTIVLVLSGLVGFALMRYLGGSFLYFITLDPDVKSPASMTAWFFYVLWFCLLIQAGALIQLGVWLSSGRPAAWTFLLCGLGLLSAFLLGRIFTVFFTVALALCWHYKYKRIRVIQLFAVGAAITAYLGIAGLYREWISPNFSLENTATLAELASRQKDLAFRYVVSNFEELSNLAELIEATPVDIPYQFGSTFTPIFVKPIPRALLPSKPLGASALFTSRVSPGPYDNGFVTALGAWGEWYLNFSWIGLIVGMAMMGAFSAIGYRAMSGGKAFGRVLLFSIYLVVLFSWLRSDFNAATVYGLYYFIPIILALAYITKPRAPRSVVAL